MDAAAALLAGLLGGLAVAIFEWLVYRRQRELERTRLSLEIQQLSDLVRDTTDSVRHRLAGGEEYEFYRSSALSPGDDLVGEPPPMGLREGAEGSWSFQGGLLEISTTNAVGSMALRLRRYRFETATADVIHARAGMKARTLRVACEARAVGGHHTLVFVLKSPGDPGGVHLGSDQRMRVREDEFRYFEKWFTFASDKDSYLRLVARSATQSGSRLEVRNLVVSERLGGSS